MTFDEWFDEYRPIENKDGDSGLVIDDKCYGFETYAPDLNVVLDANAENPLTVWTVIEVDGEQYVCDGYHLVNRMGYLITEKESTGESLCIPYID